MCRFIKQRKLTSYVIEWNRICLMGTEYDTCRAAPCIFIKILQELTKYLHGKTS